MQACLEGDHKTVDIAQFATHQKRETRLKIIILNHEKDHLISHILDNNRCKKMFDSLVKLFQNYYASQYMLL